MQSEGRPGNYVKFTQQRNDVDAVHPEETAALNVLRTFLRERGLLGERELETESGGVPERIGFGNVSMRCGDTQEFVISGTNTGGLEQLGADGYVRVTSVYIGENRLECAGRIDASAESMSHAAVYQALSGVRYVCHVHSAALWAKREGIPSTSPEATYGTPEIARAILDVCRMLGRSTGVVAMGGHEPGFLFYAPSLDALLALVQEVDSGHPHTCP